MENASVLEGGVHPSDRWLEAQRRLNTRKKAPRKVGGTADRRDAMITRLIGEEDKRRRRVNRVVCPECAAVYSRSYVSTHRRDKHGVVGDRAIHVGYVPAAYQPSAQPYLVFCPECSIVVHRSAISRHRREFHGVVNKSGYHQGYVRANP